MKQLKLTALILVLALTGCTGPGEVFESRTYGVRNSQWYGLSTSERYAAKQSYLQEQALEEQRNTNRLIREQNEELRRAQLEDSYSRNNRHHAETINRQASISRHQQKIYQEAQRNRWASDESLAVEEAKRRSLITQQHEQENRDIAEAKRRSLITQQRDQENRDIAEAKQRSLITQQRDQENRDIAEAKRRSLITQQRDQENRDIAEAKRQSLISSQREQTQRQQSQAQEQRDIAEATRRSMQTYNAENISHNTHSPTTNNWQPNDGHIVLAGEIVMNQQRELGRRPSVQEMQQKLQALMGLTATQSTTIIDEMGLS